MTKDAHQKNIGSHNRTKEGIHTKEKKGVFTIERRKRGSTGVCGGSTEKELH